MVETRVTTFGVEALVQSPQPGTRASVFGVEVLVRLALSVEGSVPAPTTVSGSMLVTRRTTGTVFAFISIFGSLVATAPAPLTREFFANLGLIRPLFPWIIYRWGVTHSAELTDGVSFYVNLHEPFVVASTASIENDTTLRGLGGAPNWIGLLVEEVRGDTTVQVLRFRAPELAEVVVALIEVDGVRRPITQRWNGVRWEEYQTLPERSLEGMNAFDLLDTSGTYAYFARILGVVMAQWQYDTQMLGRMRDARHSPDHILSLLLTELGLDPVYEVSSARKREMLRRAIELSRLKGTDPGLRLALRALGYTGYVTNVWAKPNSTAFDYFERPIGYSNDTPGPYYPASQVGVHVNDRDGRPLPSVSSRIRAEVAAFLGPLLPAHVRIRFFATDRSVGDVETISVSDSFQITDI